MDDITYLGTNFILTPLGETVSILERNLLKFTREYGDTYPSLSILVPLG